MILAPVLLALALAPGQASVEPDPDRLYADRVNLASARLAATIWDDRLARDPWDFEAAWKLARACYWLGGHDETAARRGHLERGVAAGRRAVAIEQDRPEGHFWMAANMGALAESFGIRQGLRYRTPIREALETVLRLDPAYQGGSADRALGRWYFRVPRLFGGSHERSVEHLRRSLRYHPHSTASHYFLAETLLAMGRRTEAFDHLRSVLAAPLDPEWTPEDEEFKSKARALLTKLRERP